MDEAERLCDRVAILDDGRVLAIDTPAALIERVRAHRHPRRAGESGGRLRRAAAADAGNRRGTMKLLATTEAKLFLREPLALFRGGRVSPDPADRGRRGERRQARAAVRRAALHRRVRARADGVRDAARRGVRGDLANPGRARSTSAGWRRSAPPSRSTAAPRSSSPARGGKPSAAASSAARRSPSSRG
jgi:hypothetical protein